MTDEMRPGHTGACYACPRACGADREGDICGLCGVGAALRVARVSLHAWEEPPISGERGSGAVFFSGCSLGCEFCQNRPISHGAAGRDVSEDELCRMLLALQEQGAHNINLVTPSHYAPQLAKVLRRIKPRLTVPVVYNTSGYDTVASLRLLDGLVDIYLPDFKYASSDLANRYSHAADYPAVAEAALCEMYRQVGEVCFSAEGMLRRGMIVRHLVLPSCRHDSMAVLDRLAALLPVQGIRLSLMSQYTPEFAKACPYPELHRRVTSFEYQSVLAHAERLGFEGYFQDRSSATSVYTPDFMSE